MYKYMTVYHVFQKIFIGYNKNKSENVRDMDRGPIYTINEFRPRDHECLRLNFT